MTYQVLAATLAIGWSAGAIVGSNLQPADGNPIVQTRLQQLSVQRNELEQRAVNREHDLDEREGDTCYWAFKTGTGSDADIVDNNLVQGQATVTLQTGQVFETQSCQDWKRQ